MNQILNRENKQKENDKLISNKFKSKNYLQTFLHGLVEL